MKQLWMDNQDDMHTVGDRGYLVERSHAFNGWTSYGLYDRPAHTNQSHKPRLEGWCGTTNDGGVYGHGIGRIVKTTKNGRAQVVKITDAVEIAEYLEESGYPDLE